MTFATTSTLYLPTTIAVQVLNTSNSHAAWKRHGQGKCLQDHHTENPDRDVWSVRAGELKLRKCDESKPICRNCTTRSLPCSYATTSSPKGPSSPAHVDSNHSTEGPDLEDLQLWHHWLTAVCSTFSDDDNSLIIWRDNIPKVAFKYRFVAQLLLALSALHLARSNETESSAYITKSTALQTSAMSGMMAALSDEPSSSRSSALFVAAMLLWFCSLGKGPSPGQYLVFSDKGVPPWMDLLQGVKSILTQHKHIIAGIMVEAETESGQFIDPEELFSGYSKAMEGLTQRISVLYAEDKSFDKYTVSLEVLKGSFRDAFELRNGEVKTKSHLILAWMYRIGEDFQIALQERRPMAMVILAHYLVIFSRLEDAWYVQGWTRHIMAAIGKDTHPAYERWLEWPAQHLKC